jgi:hypothetical protein
VHLREADSADLRETRGMLTLSELNSPCSVAFSNILTVSSEPNHVRFLLASPLCIDIVTDSRKGGHCYLHGNEGNR